jgi:hypothetical protein
MPQMVTIMKRKKSERQDYNYKNSSIFLIEPKKLSLQTDKELLQAGP